MSFSEGEVCPEGLETGWPVWSPFDAYEAAAILEKALANADAADAVAGQSSRPTKTLARGAFHTPAALAILCLTLGGAALPAAEDKLKVPDGHAPLCRLKAEGVQIYECKAKKDDPTAYEWVLKGPRADLFDAAGKKVGRHYGGPTWEADDGSNVAGTVPPTAVVPQAGGVPWLLLKAKSAQGDGLFGKVTYIQRVDTTGGVAPRKCDESYAGTELHVPYKAVYVFYESRK
jgi:hypothetical protein